MMNVLMHIQTRYKLLFCTLLLFVSGVVAQETGFPFIRNYSPKEYDNAPQIWSVVQQNNGLMYFGANGAVLEYDSKRWTAIPIPNKTIVYALCIDSAQTMYVGAVNEFGFLQTDTQGKLQFQSLVGLVAEKGFEFGAIRQIKISNAKVYFLSYEAIFEYSALPSPQVKTFKPLKGNRLLGLFTHQGKVYAHQKNVGLMRVGNDSLEMVSDFYADKVFRAGLSVSPDSILIPTRTKGVFVYNPATNVSTNFSIVQPDFLHNDDIYAATLLPLQQIGLGSLEKGLLVVSKSGATQQQWNENRLLYNNTILYIYNTADHNLWLGLSNGISRTEPTSAWSYWNKNAGLNGWVNHILRFDNKLYAATDNHVYVIENDEPQEIKGIPSGTCWYLLAYPVANNKQILLVGTSTGVYQIQQKQATAIRTGSHAAKLYISPSNPQRLFSVDLPNLISLVYKNGKWIDEGKWADVNGDIRAIAEDNKGNLWLGTYDAGIIKVEPDTENITKPKKVTHYQLSSGLPSLRLVYPHWVHDSIFFGTEKGLYQYNAATDNFEPYCNIDRRLCSANQDIYYLGQSPQGDIWLLPRRNKNNDIVCLRRNKNGSYDWINKPFRALPQMEFGSFHADTNGVVWFGGSEGLYRYDQRKDIKQYDATFYTLIRKVTIGDDSVVYYGDRALDTNLSGFDYEHNSIKIEYAATFFDDETKNVYIYKLENFDENWSNWSGEATAVYTNLFEGSYTFSVKARNMYDNESITAFYKIRILPPWYRTWWAYLLYVLLLLASVYLIVKLYTRRLLRQKEQLEQLVKKRTAEIEIKNDALFQQNNEITLQRDLLAKQTKKITDSITYARNIQNAVLPKHDALEQILPQHFVFFKPRDIVSGDFYFVKQINNYILVAAADCTGHGVPGAFMSMLGITTINSIIREQTTDSCHTQGFACADCNHQATYCPASMLNRLRHEIKSSLHQTGNSGESQDGMDLSLCIINTNNNFLQYAGAYNSLIIVRDNELTEYKADYMPVGVYKMEKPFTRHDIQLQTNDMLYLFSDGYADQIGGTEHRKFMKRGFKNLLQQISTLNMEEQKQTLHTHFDEWKNTHAQVDDVLVIGVKV